MYTWISYKFQHQTFNTGEFYVAMAWTLTFLEADGIYEQGTEECHTSTPATSHTRRRQKANTNVKYSSTQIMFCCVSTCTKINYEHNFLILRSSNAATHSHMGLHSSSVQNNLTFNFAGAIICSFARNFLAFIWHFWGDVRQTFRSSMLTSRVLLLPQSRLVMLSGVLVFVFNFLVKCHVLV